MKNTLKVGVGFFIVLGIVGFLYYQNKEKTPVDDIMPIVTNDDSVLGCYVSKLAKDVYTLKINNQVDDKFSGVLAFNNYEKDSSSGIFAGMYRDGILLGDYLFSSEGVDSQMQVVFKKDGDAFVRGYGPTILEGNSISFENLSGVNFDTNSTFAKDEDCLETFTEVNNKFSFEYDPFYKAFERNQEQNLPDMDWRLNSKQKGSLLASLFISKTYLPNTNFSYGQMTIGASTDPKEIKSCSLAGNGETKEGMKDISGYPFTQFTSSDAGAGNFAKTTSYRGLLDGDCYALEYTIHSTNVANYSPDQNIKEFDETEVQKEFEKIIRSFKFLVNSD